MVQLAAQSGFLLTADISGYTQFLTGSELEHGHEIIRDLMRLLSSSLRQVVEIVEYEGDAVFCYAGDTKLRDPLLLIDLLERTYISFSDRIFNVERASSCTCRACKNAPNLDLKFFLHYGQYIVDDHGKGQNLSGPDVILLHRLMKNRIAEERALRAYIFATDAALDRLGRPEEFVQHLEEYEHFGTVTGGVADLRPVVENHRTAREIRASEKNAFVVFEGVVRSDPVYVWDYFFDPVKRPQWDTHLLGIETRPNGKRRRGIGAELHCAHGDFKSVGTILDWKPFRYFTQEYVSSGGFAAPPSFLMTLETEPAGEDGTRVRQILELRTRHPLKRLMMRMLRRRIQAAGNADLVRLDQLLQRDREKAS